MPDFAMCEGVGCAKRDACLRFRAVPNEHQNYNHWDARGCVSIIPVRVADEVMPISFDAEELAMIREMAEANDDWLCDIVHRRLGEVRAERFLNVMLERNRG